MLKIRLKRIGRKGQPYYRVVVQQSHRARNSSTVAEIGFYNPRENPTEFRIDKAEVEKWLGYGAQPTDTVEQLLVKEGILKEIKRGSTLPQQKKKKKDSDEEEQPEAGAAQTVAQESSKEEAASDTTNSEEAAPAKESAEEAPKDDSSTEEAKEEDEKASE